MRSRSVVSALLVLTAGAAASLVARRLARRPAVAAPIPVPAVAPAPVAVAVESEGVVLPFTRPAAPAPAKPTVPARCGENGGITKAGAPCAARATSNGRCHHHRVAA